MKTNISTYLKKLKFNPKLEESLIADYIRNPRLLILLLISIILLGTASFISLPKVYYPKINIPVVVVTTVLPGANPTDIESLVTIPIEDKVKGLSGLKTYQSTSRDSASIMYLEFNTGIDPDKAKTDVQSAVNEVTTLPSNTQTPQVVKYDYENQPVWTFALIGKGDSASLIRFAKILEDAIKTLPAVDKVETTGLEEQEIQIDIKPEVINSYKVSPLVITQAIKTALSSYPAGIVNTSQSSLSLNIDQGINSINDFRKITININNKNVELGDIAIISERSKPDQLQSFYASPQDPKVNSAITFNVYRNNNITIAQSVSDVDIVIKKQLAYYPDQFSVVSKYNQSDEVNEQFNRLMHDLTFTIILIMVTLLLFVGLKQALVASIAIPLSFLITFSVMKITNTSLNTVSFLALLLALGLLIDDTIVVISAMTSYYRTGKFTPRQTTLLVWKDFLIAVTTTTLTTIFAFLPILVTNGIIGEFIKPVPIVVSSSLAASFIVAMFITMPFMAIILKPDIPKRVKTLVQFLIPITLIGVFIFLFRNNPFFPLQMVIFIVLLIIIYLTKNSFILRLKTFVKKIQKNQFAKHINTEKLITGFISFEIITEKYKTLISRIISSKKQRKRSIAMILAFCVFCYSLAGFGMVKNEYFPKINQKLVYVNLELPEGTNLETTKQEALKIIPDLLQTPEISFISLDIGNIYTSGVNFNGAGSNKAFFTVNLMPKEERKLMSSQIADGLRTKFANYQNGRLSIVEQASGPPAGSDIQIKLFGDELNQLDKSADQIITFLKTQPGVTNVDKSVKSGTSKLTFVPDKSKLALYGINNDSLGLWLRIFASGYSASEIRLGGRTEDITIRLQPKTQTPEEINELMIPTASGYIPIADLGKLQLEPNPSLILREKGLRTISVSASATSGHSITDINKILTAYINKNISFPANYMWSVSGVNEENQKSTQSIMQAMLIAIVLISLTMIIQFKSFRKAFIVIMIIPLSIAGVFLVFSLTNTPLSFPAMIGILALFGIVVKNSILVVDKISSNLETGMEYTEAIIDGASSRLEAIGLTSIAAVLGLVPITISDPLWRGVGLAIISGLSFSGLIILLFIPTVYYFFFEDKIK